ncbi:hypothetical protein [Streptomyces sp. NPDC006335]|uniref:hypothetical protein n=1 Tax=Streptomyces sp. NPDC006335 TaxID=3156895 RepID=UPI0033A8BFC1
MHLSDMRDDEDSMPVSAMRDKAAGLLLAVRTERGERRQHMLEEAQLWIDLAHTFQPAPPTETVPDGTMIRIRTRGGALTVVQERTAWGDTALYPWQCLGCGHGRDARYGDGAPFRDVAHEQATRHARRCWAEPAPVTAPPTTVVAGPVDMQGESA